VALSGGSPAPVATLEPIVGSAVLLADSNTIAYTDPNGICRRPSLTVTESPTRVSLTLSETDAGLGDCARVNMPLPMSYLDVSLTAPLGSRQLVDALTGNPVPYFGPSPHPTGAPYILDSPPLDAAQLINLANDLGGGAS
jgi:hypothetical protein